MECEHEYNVTKYNLYLKNKSLHLNKTLQCEDCGKTKKTVTIVTLPPQDKNYRKVMTFLTEGNTITFTEGFDQEQDFIIKQAPKNWKHT